MLMPYLVAGGLALGLAAAGGLATRIGPWYRDLAKPRLQPPDWAFGPAWTIILACWAASLAIAWMAADGAADERSIIIVFSVNAILFLLWSPLFFMLRRPDLALAEMVPFWLSILVSIVVLWPISTTAALLLMPYQLWVTFAGWLNWQIVALNPRRARY